MGLRFHQPSCSSVKHVGLGRHHSGKHSLLGLAAWAGGGPEWLTPDTHQLLAVLIHCVLLSWREVEGREAHALANPVAGMRVEEQRHPPDTCRQSRGVGNMALLCDKVGQGSDVPGSHLQSWFGPHAIWACFSWVYKEL